jgi:hypothetical protein
MSRSRDVAKQGGMTIVIPTTVNVGAGSASVGANGQVTFTNATNMMLNNVFSSTYRDYRIVMDITGVGAAQYFTVRLKGAGTIYGSYTTVGGFYSVSGGTGSFLNMGTSNQGIGLGYIGYTGGARAGLTVDIFQPAEPVATILNFHSGGHSNNSAHSMTSGSVINFTDTAMDSIEIALQTGLTFTGTLRIYGYNNG